MDPLIVLSDEIERANHQADNYQQQISFFIAHHPDYPEDVRYQQMVAEKMEVMRTVTKMRKKLTKRVIEISREKMAIYTMERDGGTIYFADVATLPPPSTLTEPTEPEPEEPEEPEPGEGESKAETSSTPAPPAAMSPDTSPQSHSPTAMVLAEELEMSPLMSGEADQRQPDTPPLFQQSPRHSPPHTPPHTSPYTLPHATLYPPPHMSTHMPTSRHTPINSPPPATPLSPVMLPAPAGAQTHISPPVPPQQSPAAVQPPQTQFRHMQSTSQMPQQIQQHVTQQAPKKLPQELFAHSPQQLLAPQQQTAFRPMHPPAQPYQAPQVQLPHNQHYPHNRPSYTTPPPLNLPHTLHTNPPCAQLPQMQPQQLQIEQYTAAKARLASIMRDHSELRIYFVGLDGHNIAAPEHQMIRRCIKAGQDPTRHMRGQYRSYPVSYVKSSNSFVHNRLFFPEFHAY